MELAMSLHRKYVRHPCAPPPPTPEKVSIPIEDIAPLLKCCVCSGVPLKTPAARCLEGHLACADCCRRSASGEGSCPKCGCVTLSRRDDALERVVRDLPAAAAQTLLQRQREKDKAGPSRQASETSVQRALMLDRQREAEDKPGPSRQASETSVQRALMLDRQGEAEHKPGPSRQASETSVQRALMLDVDKLEEARRLGEKADSLIARAAATNVRLSYSPLACPFPCGRMVTGSGLLPHFEFLHPRVPVAEVNLDHPHPVTLLQEGGARRCQALLLVHLDATGPGPETPEGGRRGALVRATRSSHSMLVNRLLVASVQAGRLHQRRVDDDATNDVTLAVWVAALHVLPDVTCTLRVTNDRDPPRSLVYSGPVSAMRASQRPGEVFWRGECLLVPPALLRHQPPTLTVAFHHAS